MRVIQPLNERRQTHEHEEVNNQQEEEGLNREGAAKEGGDQGERQVRNTDEEGCSETNRLFEAEGQDQCQGQGEDKRQADGGA